MGNTVTCDPCTAAVNHSVFTFSEELVRKVVEGRRSRPLSKEELAALDNTVDQDLFDELRCIDDSHTRAFGLSTSRVQLLLDQLEEAIDDLAVNEACDSTLLRDCFTRHKECPQRCTEQVTNYDECVDKATRKRVKEAQHRGKCTCRSYAP